MQRNSSKIILNNNLIENKIRIGINDIAQKAGVSKATVDRVLYNRGRVSSETREKVLNICEELNYQPNLLAQRLASDKIYRFTTLIPRQTKDNAYWAAPLFGIEKAEKEISEYGVIVEKYFFNLKDENSFRKKTFDIIMSNPDGILFAPIFERESKEFAKKCDLKSIPYVFIDSNIENQNNLSFFGQNSYQSGYLAGKLLSFNLRKRSEVIILNFARELANYPHFRDREKGFVKYIRDHYRKCRIVNINVSLEDEKYLHEVLSENIHKYNAALKKHECSSTIECSHPDLISPKPDETYSRANAFVGQFISIFNAVMERK